MLKEHHDLLETIELAQEQCAALAKKGNAVQGVAHQLNWANREISSRIQYLERDAEKLAAKKKAPAAPAKPRNDPKPKAEGEAALKSEGENPQP